METKYTDYANAIVRDFLDLRTGDALSINTDERDLEFAKLIAQTALPVTDVTVKIVVIENGKPAQVMEFDPAPPAHMPRSSIPSSAWPEGSKGIISSRRTPSR